MSEIDMGGGRFIEVVTDPYLRPGEWVLVAEPDPLDVHGLQRWQDFWEAAWGQVFKLALDAQAVALYGRCALCEGMGV